MSFPSIDSSKPLGTYMVSTIDDFERETRSWLEQGLRSISGYPNYETSAIASWTSATRPSSSPNGNILLGYNTTLNSLELIAPNQSGSGVTTNTLLSTSVKKEIALLAHPVGEYYWTSDTSFNPATAWGGTWERIQDGRMLISNNTTHTVGSTGGAETVTLTKNQIPEHDHPHTHKHRHNRGDMNITGEIATPTWFVQVENYLSGAFYYDSDNNNGGVCCNGSDPRPKATFDASRSWTGNTSYDQTQNSDSPVGGGKSHNNMPPYRTAVLWHRIA